jgi:nitrate/nitrite transporter NarK
MTGSRRATANLLLATLAFALCFTAWSLIAPFAKTFKHDLGLNYTEALLLTAIPVVLGSLLRVPLGIVTDRYGGRIVFTLLLAFSALPAVLFGYAHAYWALLAVGFLLGIAGASFAVGVPFVAGWYGRERQGFALGVYGIGNIGTAIAFFGAPPVSNHWGRATVGWVTGIGLLAGAALFFLLARDAPHRGAPADYGAVLRGGRRLYRLAFFYFITFGGFVAMGFLLPTLLQDWFGYSKTTAGARAAGFIIAATVARPVGGWISDRIAASHYGLNFARKFCIVVGMALSATIGLAGLASQAWLALLLLSIAFFGVSVATSSILALPADVSARGERSVAGTVAGFQNCISNLAGIASPAVIGLLKDATGSFTPGLISASVMAIIGCLIYIFMLGPIRSDVLEHVVAD